jgi:hypothetical protein
VSDWRPTADSRQPTAGPGRLPVFIRHRVNRVEDLAGLDPAEGAEIDLRSDPCRPRSILLHHDPWTAGTDLDAWLRAWARSPGRGPLILDTKEDGLEDVAERKAADAGVTDLFFLDTTVPTLARRVLSSGRANHAVRLSRHEPIEGLEAFRRRAAWVWVDCFGGEPLAPEVVASAARDFRVCLASPELHGLPLDAVDAFAGLWPLADAICTDDPGAWLRRFGRG